MINCASKHTCRSWVSKTQLITVVPYWEEVSNRHKVDLPQRQSVPLWDVKSGVFDLWEQLKSGFQVRAGEWHWGRCWRGCFDLQQRFDPPPSRVQTKAQEIGILFQIPCNPPARDGGAHFRYSDPPYYLNPSHPVSLWNRQRARGQ